MASQKGGNVSFGLMIGLIVSFFVILGLIYTTYSNNAQLAAKTEEAKHAKDDLVAANQREVQLRRDLSDINMLVHGSNSPVDIEKIKRDNLKVAGQKLKEILEQQSLSSEQFAKDLIKDGKFEAKPKEYENLQQLYDDLFAELAATIPEMNRLRMEKQNAITDAQAKDGTARKEKQALETNLEKERSEKGELNQKLLADAKSFDAEKRRLEEGLKASQDAAAKKDSDNLVEQARLQSRINELQGVITHLKETKRRTLADTDADGEIVNADQRLGLAWIDIGLTKHLQRGLIFEVFRYVKGGVRKSKGRVKVRRVEPDMSEVAVVEQTDPSDPIVQGDFVASPFFDAKKQMVFVFVGDPSNASRYTKDELVRRIEETGGRVDKAISVNTDFMIAMEKADQSDEFQKGVQFGVTIMRESELLDYLGR